MASSKMRIDEIQNRFSDKFQITDTELLEFYRELEPDLKDTLFRWRVHYLEEKGIIRRLKRGVFLLEQKKIYTPQVSVKIKRIYNAIKSNFPYTNFCIWETSWLHDFMIHQPITSDIIIDIDNETMNPAFSLLREKKENVYINPNKNEIKNYILASNNIIIKPLVFGAPTKLVSNVKVPKVEKILVDIFIDSNLFISYQGQEKKNIFENIYANYSINATTLYRYAHKRGVKDRLINFLSTEAKIDGTYLGV